LLLAVAHGTKRKRSVGALHGPQAKLVSPFKAPVVPLDGEPIKALRDIVRYMDAISEHRQARRAWHRVAELLLDAAERNGSVDAVRRQLVFALLMDGKLDAAATEPAR
jgi:hypothetical protein